jgi:hypothetical protein
MLETFNTHTHTNLTANSALYIDMWCPRHCIGYSTYFSITARLQSDPINIKHCAYGTEYTKFYLKIKTSIIFEKLIIKMVNWNKFNGCPQHAKPAMRGKRGVDLPTLDPVARSGWVVSVTPRPFYCRERDPISIVKEAEWAWGRYGQVRKISPHTGPKPCTVVSLKRAPTLSLLEWRGSEAQVAE